MLQRIRENSALTVKIHASPPRRVLRPISSGMISSSGIICRVDFGCFRLHERYDSVVSHTTWMRIGLGFDTYSSCWVVAFALVPNVDEALVHAITMW